jgi:predicted transcriptional regulator
MFGNTRTLKLQVEEPFSNRSRLSIIYHTLMICNDEQVSQTRLMYKANLSYFTMGKRVIEVHLVVDSSSKHSET